MAKRHRVRVHQPFLKFVVDTIIAAAMLMVFCLAALGFFGFLFVIIWAFRGMFA